MSKHPMITRTPGVQGGYPCIAGTRTPVSTIVELYRDIYPGDVDEIQRSLPHLTHEQIRAALRYYEDCPELVDEDIARQEEAIVKILSGEWDHVVVSDTDRSPRQPIGPRQSGPHFRMTDEAGSGK